MGNGASASVPAEQNCALAGEWVPCRKDAWHNRTAFLPSHKDRARQARTRVTYKEDGTGSGKVGEFVLRYKVTTIAPGQFMASARIPMGEWGFPWAATDGNLTLLSNGTLHVQYPSNGITEYWCRADGRGAATVQASQASARAIADASPSLRPRPLKLALRHFGPGNPLGGVDLCWHWALCVGEENSCYEVSGSMAVLGPEGLVAKSSPLLSKLPKPTHLSKFDGVLTLPGTTCKRDEELISFTRQWVKQHPIYHIPGPNCQTYAEDLYTFLTGANLPYAKSASRLDSLKSRRAGPEHHSETHWIKPEKRPTR